MEAPIEVTVRLTERDLRAGMLHTMRRRSRWLLRLIVVVALLIVALTLFGWAIGADFSLVAPALWPMLLAIVVITLLIPITIRLTARRQLRSSTELSQPHTFRFDENGFDVESAHSSGRCSWEALSHAEEVREGLILYRSKDVFHLLPRRAFASADELGALRGLLARQLGESANLKSD